MEYSLEEGQNLLPHTLDSLHQGQELNQRLSVNACQAPGKVEQSKIQLIRELYGSLAAFAQEVLRQNPSAMAYLNIRGINGSTIKKAGLGFLSTPYYQRWYKGLTP